MAFFCRKGKLPWQILNTWPQSLKYLNRYWRSKLNTYASMDRAPGKIFDRAVRWANRIFLPDLGYSAFRGVENVWIKPPLSTFSASTLLG